MASVSVVRPSGVDMATDLKALDAANDGVLADLVRLFVNLESAALTSELERPAEPAAGVAVDVARTLAAQLAEVRRRRTAEVQDSLGARAIAVGGRLNAWFRGKRDEIERIFRAQGLGDIAVHADVRMPPDERTGWFRRQVTESAHTAGHYADFSFFVGWASLRIRTGETYMRYVASLHGAGREPGVMAVTTFGELEPIPHEDPPEREYVRTTADAFRFVHTETLAQVEERAGELEQLLDEGLAVALAALMKHG
jgi:hypothetical protein